ncbi:uncharacterized protein L969DRAFT_105473 [Mixia osmundae IAM 14324]|uniref:Uncharacterized protein n=1 Tax=Mixia osmundae (strain CBS 9802 / IAM 14324 / JCM 22182 / KY 12970) TaxID=764103 RepID=G7DS15_MIXOS|nr:uncharacterized protein L969DRAFT_105473 [Mixia osmundae IAM 14324]KEI37234.1 hypothetical protein L969DRAFT_105473 [Mixia osmundae IAM 14324]GAA93375.1 hypothetical protein E5Q_00015 [Mixia osmundae IAM 14324]
MARKVSHGRTIPAGRLATESQDAVRAVNGHVRKPASASKSTEESSAESDADKSPEPQRRRLDSKVSQIEASTSEKVGAEQEASRLALHRLQFVDPQFSSITCLALTPSTFRPSTCKHLSFSRPDLSQGAQERELIAVGRAESGIELWTWLDGDGARPLVTARPAAPSSDRKGKAKQSSLDGNRQGYVQLAVLPLPLPSRVEHLAFAHQNVLSPSEVDLADSTDELAREQAKLLLTPPRLFSSGGGSELVEWSWLGSQRGQIRNRIDSQGGSIWSVAINATSSIMAIGCEDGCVRLISLWDDTLEHSRRFDRVGTRMLSIAWGLPVPFSGARQGLEDVLLVTGGADSSIRKWDARSGRCVAKMTTERRKDQQTLVWAVTVLSDGTIASGDSMGNVKLWDPRMNVQLQSFAAHQADCLCLSVSYDGRSLFTSGVDQRVTEIAYVPQARRWSLSFSRRVHTHDVRALAVSPMYASNLQGRSPAAVPLLISGGLDLGLSVLPIAPVSSQRRINPISDGPAIRFEDATQRRYSYAPAAAPIVHICRSSRLVVCQRLRSIGIWRLNAKMGDADLALPWVKLVDIEMKLASNLVCTAISADGRWLATSDTHELRLFELTQKADGSLAPRKIKPLTVAVNKSRAFGRIKGASAIAFTADNQRLIAASLSTQDIAIFHLAEACKTVHVFARTRGNSSAERSIVRLTNGHAHLNGNANGHAHVNGVHHDLAEGSSSSSDDEADAITVGDNSDHPPITAFAVSSDGQWLAAGSGLHVEIYNLDSLRHQWSMPSTLLPANAMTFLPGSCTLVIGLPNNTLQTYNVELKREQLWLSGKPLDSAGTLQLHRDQLIGLSTHASLNKIIAWGSSWAQTIDLPPFEQQGKKRRRESAVVADSTASKPTSVKYQSLLAFDFLGANELAAIERPFQSLLSTLPKAWSKPGKFAS